MNLKWSKHLKISAKVIDSVQLGKEYGGEGTYIIK